MELSVLLFLALLTGLLLLLVQRHPKAHGRLPPGPRPLPPLGNLLQMDRRGLLKSFQRFREKYGDVFTVHLGPRPVVCCVEPSLAGEKSRTQSLLPTSCATHPPLPHTPGMVFANGNRWKVLRRFSLISMKDFGMGKRSVEERIQEEAQCLIEELRKSKGALVDPTFFFHSITTNIICSIVFGKRFHYQDQEFLKMLNLFCQSFSLIRSAFSQLFEFFSGFLKYLPRAHRQLYKNPQEINAYTGHSVEKHGETLDPSAPQDLIDTYLLHMEKEKSNPHSEFSHQNLIINTFSLFFAGTETTSTTLRYGFLLMLTYPHVAQRVYKEIEQVIGPHRPPALDDQAKMPYTEAVIHEIQRFADLLPMGVPHIVTQQTSFRGYIIPKVRPAGTPHPSSVGILDSLNPLTQHFYISQLSPLVFVFSFCFFVVCVWRVGMAISFDLLILPQDTEVYLILSTALHDPHYFEKPDAFNPDHFLDANGALKKNEAFIPFSLGKLDPQFLSQTPEGRSYPQLEKNNDRSLSIGHLIYSNCFTCLIPFHLHYNPLRGLEEEDYIPKGTSWKAGPWASILTSLNLSEFIFLKRKKSVEHYP
uniref:Cytochrome P450 family 2 subfamily B member 6 n=1 Tax=Rhinopithecus bieti TaxID=61621 RepID=A0A2K6KQF9_RHIBE